MIRFLFSCAQADVTKAQTLFAGLEAHADVEAFPVYLGEEGIPAQLFKLLPYLTSLDNTWIVGVDGHAMLATVVKFAESVAWQFPEQVRFASDDAFSHWTLAQFHKRVFVEGAYRENA